MSVFTAPLRVEPLPDGRHWRLTRSLEYHVGAEDSNLSIVVPEGYITDFASVPRIFWVLFPPFGRYTAAATLHDYCYEKRLFNRKECDRIFLEAMEVLKVNWFKRHTMYRAVRMFGWYGYNKKGETT